MKTALSRANEREPNVHLATPEVYHGGQTMNAAQLPLDLRANPLPRTTDLGCFETFIATVQNDHGPFAIAMHGVRSDGLANLWLEAVNRCRSAYADWLDSFNNTHGLTGTANALTPDQFARGAIVVEHNRQARWFPITPDDEYDRLAAHEAALS